ncbi:MAG: tRNA (guanine(46)-N(7))-methyltransferase TrmB [Hyphomicrobiales bacterium]|nr:tRNA (guanine(46)-N(7))-methyltransferase TrmB [Hyphomicrobiales bacterium]
MDHLLPKLTLDPASLGSMPLTRFPPGLTQLRLEVGFGGGEHLAHEARLHPHIAFIGCEPFANGVARLLVDIDAGQLTNVRIYPDDAGAIIDALPAACLAGVDVLFPDPWPKRRQQQRRFISDARLIALARVMQQGASLRFATDIDDYAAWTLARIARSPHFLWRATRADDWRQPWPEWPGTRYEAKAKAAGRPSVWLVFERNAVPATSIA